MGLLDVLNTTQNDQRGQRGSSTGGGGLSPITLAVLGLLAYKAWKSATSQPSTASAAPAGPGPVQDQPSAAPAAPASASPDQGASPGGLGDILRGALGGILGGGAAGSVLSGGLADLLKQFQQAGQGEVAKSWVSNGPKQSISSDDLAGALGADQMSALMTQSGLSREDLLSGLSQHLPAAVHALTPDGRLPTEHEVSRSL
ncbi:MAG TPA: YidB family protein [Xanthobacteraceae bacterium]|jgi:uncharacterized protein YidB (DUF937 family)